MRAWLAVSVLCAVCGGCDDDNGVVDGLVQDLSGPVAAVDMTMSTAPATASVNVGDNFFSPASVTIAAGGTVTWTWTGANTHTVTSTTAVFGSGTPQSSGTFNFTFPDPGTFPYFCEVHGAVVQSGTVTVQ